MPGRWNDKTVVHFDGFISDIYRGIRYSDISYNLYNSANTAINYCGAWILVDGGYLVSTRREMCREMCLLCFLEQIMQLLI